MVGDSEQIKAGGIGVEGNSERVRAAQALKYATIRREGLVNWTFDIARVPRKDHLTWTEARVQPYFTRVR
jgi:hypothetical protein